MNRKLSSPLAIKRFTLVTLFCICYLFFLPVVQAQNSLVVGYGVGLSDVLIQSQSIESTKVNGLGWRQKTEQTWQHGLLGFADFFIDTEWRHLKGDDEGINYSLDIYAVKPVVRFYSDEARQSLVFYEMALGLSYFTRKSYENIRLSNDIQFAMHFAVGWHLGMGRKTQLAIGYHHYSNGYLDRPNQGLDFVLTTVSYSFD